MTALQKNTILARLSEMIAPPTNGTSWVSRTRLAPCYELVSRKDGTHKVYVYRCLRCDRFGGPVLFEVTRYNRKLTRQWPQAVSLPDRAQNVSCMIGFRCPRCSWRMSAYLKRKYAEREMKKQMAIYENIDENLVISS